MFASNYFPDGIDSLLQKWGIVKSVRNHYLSISDWTQLPDAPLTDNERLAWQQYRQALRDLPQTYQSPDDVIFPEVAQG